MTVLAEPPSITMAGIRPAEPAAGLRRPGLPGPPPPAGSWPLRVGDPVSVDGYRLISRLGAGGMADVFYALARTGGPVAVKLLRAAAGAARTCQREYRLARAVHSGCTAPALGYGLSTAGRVGAGPESIRSDRVWCA